MLNYAFEEQTNTDKNDIPNEALKARQKDNSNATHFILLYALCVPIHLSFSVSVEEKIYTYTNTYKIVSTGFEFIPYGTMELNGHSNSLDIIDKTEMMPLE